MKIQIAIPRLGFMFLMLMLSAFDFCKPKDTNTQVQNNKKPPITIPALSSGNALDNLEDSDLELVTVLPGANKETVQNQDDKDDLEDNDEDLDSVDNKVSSDFKPPSSDVPTKTEDKASANRDNIEPKDGGEVTRNVASPCNKPILNVIDCQLKRSNSFPCTRKKNLPLVQVPSALISPVASERPSSNQTTNQEPCPGKEPVSNLLASSKDNKGANGEAPNNLANQDSTKNKQLNITSTEIPPDKKSNITQGKAEEEEYNKNTATPWERHENGVKKYKGIMPFYCHKIESFFSKNKPADKKPDQ